MPDRPVGTLVREADGEAFASFTWRVWRQAGSVAPCFAGATDELIVEITQPEAVSVRLGGPVHRIFAAIDGAAPGGFASTRASEGTDSLEATKPSNPSMTQKCPCGNSSRT